MSDDEDTLVAELRAKHGKIEKFDLDGQLIVIRKPSQGAILNFTNTIQAGKLGEAQVQLSLDSVVYPELKTFQELLKQNGGIASDLSSAAAELSKGGLKSLGKA
jgi:hypothetical protein